MRMCSRMYVMGREGWREEGGMDGWMDGGSEGVSE
jgi:hypothetical protein